MQTMKNACMLRLALCSLVVVSVVTRWTPSAAAQGAGGAPAQGAAASAPGASGGPQPTAESAAPSAPGSRFPSEVTAVPAPQPDEVPALDLITMGVGSLIWERHGHIALCVRYPSGRGDACYNYGIADFYHPIAMAWGFFRGTRSFWAGLERPREMTSRYAWADRTVWVQRLPFTPAETAKVVAKLEFDVQEAHKYYAYDHFWDNCTTRVRDILDEASGGKLRALRGSSDSRTFRDLAREGFYGMPMPLVVTDIAMGRVTDVVPSYWERMFLPDYLREAATAAWGVEPQVLYQRKGPPATRDAASGRGWFALLLVLWTLPVWVAARAKRWQRVTMGVAVAPAVVLGVALWGLAIISPLPYVRWNESCLLFFPGDVLLAAGATLRLKYAKVRLATLIGFALAALVGLLRQPLWAPWLLPVSLSLAIVLPHYYKNKSARTVRP